MKILKYFSLALMVISLSSCGGKKTSEESTGIETEFMSSDDSDDSETDGYLSSDESSSWDDDDSSMGVSSDSEDWDSMLDTYEQYVDEYISLVKKASKGDISAMEDYATMLEKSQELSEQLEQSKGDMSPSQCSRYLKITSKMAKMANYMN